MNNLAARALNTLRQLRYGARIDPERDWLLLLSFSAILFAGILGWNAWAFDTVANGGVIGARARAPMTSLTQASLGAVRAIFSARAAEELKYETGVYRFADPSR